MSEPRALVPHYATGGIETIDYIFDTFGYEEGLTVILANVIKYASRAKYKGQLASDLEKIRNYAVIAQEMTAREEARKALARTEPIGDSHLDGYEF